MPLYSYKAQDKQGKIIEETIQAGNRVDAAASIKADGLQVLTIKDVEQGIVKLRGGVSISEKTSFCRFTATMLRAGLSLHEAVDIIKQETESEKMKKILADIAFQTRKGRSLSSTLSQYKDVFDPVFLTMIKAGEESGTLEQSFEYLAAQLISSYEFSQKIKSSMIYPIVVIGAMFGIGLIMLIFVLPQISVVFLRMNVKLPTITRLILLFGVFVGKNVGLTLGGIAVLLVILFVLGYNKTTRRIFINSVYKIPMVKKLMNQIDVARFARTLSTLLKSGVPIIDALNVAADSLSQEQLKKEAKLFTVGVAKGQSLSDVLAESKTGFPLVMIQTIKTGEKTGSLELVLLDLADFYEKEVDYRLKRVTALIEPVLMLIIGVIVGAMVIMIVAPIYGIIGSLQDTMKN